MTQTVDTTMKDTALAMAGAVGAIRRMVEDPATRERLERAYERGGIEALMEALDDRMATMQGAYIDLAYDA